MSRDGRHPARRDSIYRCLHERPLRRNGADPLNGHNGREAAGTIRQEVAESSHSALLRQVWGSGRPRASTAMLSVYPDLNLAKLGEHPG